MNEYILDPDVCTSSLGDDDKPMTPGETAHKWTEEADPRTGVDRLVCGECGSVRDGVDMPEFYKEYTDDVFLNAKAFEAFLHEGKALKYDYVIVGGILYTMHEYDSSGLAVYWANKKHGLHMQVNTSNRYSDSGYTDAEVEVYPASYMRNDIAFAE